MGQRLKSSVGGLSLLLFFSAWNQYWSYSKTLEYTALQVFVESRID